MTDNLKLIRQARNLAKQRGHKIGEFLATRIETGYPPIASRGCMVGICEYCGAKAAVDTSPAPAARKFSEKPWKGIAPAKYLSD